MSVDRGFLDELERYLDAEAGDYTPAYVDRIIARTKHVRQRPGWSSLERWLPMDLTLRPAPFMVPRPSRILAVLALIVLIVALVAVAVGTRRPLPPPFGLARNGQVLVSIDGDILAVDPSTGRRSTMIGGPAFDFSPTYSRDGTLVLFLRGGPTDCGVPDCGLILTVANADGTNVRELTSGIPGLDWADWSADGSRIAFLGTAPSGEGHVIHIVNVDGTGTLRTLDVGRPVNEVSWLPPAGQELLFRREQSAPDDPPPGIFAARVDGSGTREISTRLAVDARDYLGASVSPNGQLLTYTRMGADQRFTIHIVDLRTGKDWVLPSRPGAAQAFAGFSPDGQHVVYHRGVGFGDRLVVAPVDGSGTGIELGPSEPHAGEGINNVAFSPDGTAVYANYDSDKTARILPVDGSAPIEVARGDLTLMAWQRLALP